MSTFLMTVGALCFVKNSGVQILMIETLLEKVTFLVEKKGADVNKADVEQWTPVGYKFVANVLCALFVSAPLR